MSATGVLQVLQEQRQLDRGTAWFVRHDLVVTAFHVVSERNTENWLSDVMPSIDYRLTPVGGEPAVALEPLLADAQADLALLRLVQGTFPGPVLALGSTEVLRPQARWEAQSYPAFHRGMFTLSGTITAVQPGTSATALQLLVEQDVQVDWGGVSGAALLVAGQVAGVIGRMTEAANTGWATPVHALRTLLHFAATASVVEELGQVLLSVCPGMQDLAHLVSELDWLSLAATSPVATAQQMAQRAWRSGPAGLSRLLQVLEINHPAMPQIQALAVRLQPHVRRPAVLTTPSQTQVVRDVLQRLRQRPGPGVALLAPLGFGGRKVIDQVVTHLQHPPERELVVRLIPRPDTTDEERLYGALYHDLRHGLALHLGQPLPAGWADYLPAHDARSGVEATTRRMDEEHFKETLRLLLEGPVTRQERVLVLVVEGLSRVAEGHLQSWAWLMNHLTNDRPLKLLLWGEQELHELCTGETRVGRFSPFQRLERSLLGPFSVQEVQQQVRERLGVQSDGALLYQLTHGHPALVEELLERAQVELVEQDTDGLRSRALATAYLRRLRREVGADPTVRDTLRRLARGDWQRCYTLEEDRLQWLGILQEDGPAAWRWAAPVFADWVQQWLG